MKFKWLVVVAIFGCLLLTVDAHEKKVNKLMAINPKKRNMNIILFTSV